MARKFSSQTTNRPHVDHPQKALAEILKEFGKEHATRRKEVGNATKQERINTLTRAFRQLAEGGFIGLQPRNLGERHIRYLINRWESEKLSPKTIISYYSQINNLLRWLGKSSAIKEIEQYLSDKNYLKNPENGKTKYAVQEDESWNGAVHKIDIEATIAKVEAYDKHVGMQMRLQEAFGLRVKESVMLKPHVSDRGTYLDVLEGTKGGRSRTVAINSEHKRKVLDDAKALVTKANGPIGDPKYSLVQAYNRYYYVVTKKFGINQEQFEVTSHGLRKQYACDRLEELGSVAPIRGGVKGDSLADSTARLITIEELGHSREDKIAAYGGSFIPVKK
jgi:integrase